MAQAEYEAELLRKWTAPLKAVAEKTTALGKAIALILLSVVVTSDRSRIHQIVKCKIVLQELLSSFQILAMFCFP